MNGAHANLRDITHRRRCMFSDLVGVRRTLFQARPGPLRLLQPRHVGVVLQQQGHPARQSAFDPAWSMTVTHHAFGNVVDILKSVTLQDIDRPRRTHTGGAYHRERMRSVTVDRFQHHVDEGCFPLTGNADGDRPFRYPGGSPLALLPDVDDKKGIAAYQRPGAVGGQCPVSGLAQ